MRLVSSGVSRAAKPVNEDAWFADDSKGLFAVSDGVGGHRGGEVASRIVIERTAEIDLGDDSKAALASLVRNAASALHAEGWARRELRDMGATLTALAVHESGSWIVHIGDSRAYLLRDLELRQLTNDHTVAYEQFRAGAFSKEELRSHPNQKLLTRCLVATRSFAVPEILLVDPGPGDTFLLCTDGLTKILTDAELAERLGGRAGAAELVAAAVAKGAEDDVTAIVVRVE